MADVTFTAPQSNPAQGAVLMALAVLVFAFMDATTKHMAMTYAVPLVVAVRYAGNLILMLAIFGPKQGRALWRIQRRGLVVVRAGCLAASSLFAALAFQRMPVAETLSIVFLAPFGVMLLAGPLLGEKVGPLQWAAATAGFAGVLLIVRPGSGLDPIGVLFAMLTAGASMVYNLLSRSLARSETTLALMFWTALIGTLAFGVTLPWTLPAAMPNAIDLGLFGALGALATLGHLLFTQSCRTAPASVIAPVNYLQLVWAGLLGWLVFDHVPDHVALVGLTLIVLGGISAGVWPIVAPRLASRASISP